MISSIIQKIKEVQKEMFLFEEIYQQPKPASGKNEFLFFVKPEITVESPAIKLDKILDLILNKISEFKLNINNIKVLSAQYLNTYDIIAQHYGVINKISGDARANISEEGKQKFRSLFQSDINNATVLGSLQFIQKHPYFTPTALDAMCQNIASEKLAGGTYVQKIKIDGNEIYLINGFHPRQLEHFTAKGRSIVVFSLSGDLDWSVARNNFIGATNPNNAHPGSIRRELLDRKDELGLSTVSSSWNGVHLSAGPVEGLVELIRYNSDFSKDKKVSMDDYQFGKLLRQHFNSSQIEALLTNTILNIDGKLVSVFDLTEEKNSEEALNILKSVLI